MQKRPPGSTPPTVKPRVVNVEPGQCADCRMDDLPLDALGRCWPCADLRDLRRSLPLPYPGKAERR